MTTIEQGVVKLAFLRKAIKAFKERRAIDAVLIAASGGGAAKGTRRDFLSRMAAKVVADNKGSVKKITTGVAAVTGAAAAGGKLGHTRVGRRSFLKGATGALSGAVLASPKISVPKNVVSNDVVNKIMGKVAITGSAAGGVPLSPILKDMQLAHNAKNALDLKGGVKGTTKSVKRVLSDLLLRRPGTFLTP
jgi:hypothetical protein